MYIYICWHGTIITHKQLHIKQQANIHTMQNIKTHTIIILYMLYKHHQHIIHVQHNKIHNRSNTNQHSTTNTKQATQQTYHTKQMKHIDITTQQPQHQTQNKIIHRSKTKQTYTKQQTQTHTHNINNNKFNNMKHKTIIQTQTTAQYTLEKTHQHN